MKALPSLQPRTVVYNPPQPALAGSANLNADILVTGIYIISLHTSCTAQTQPCPPGWLSKSPRAPWLTCPDTLMEGWEEARLAQIWGLAAATAGAQPVHRHVASSPGTEHDRQTQGGCLSSDRISSTKILERKKTKR